MVKNALIFYGLLLDFYGNCPLPEFDHSDTYQSLTILVIRNFCRRKQYLHLDNDEFGLEEPMTRLLSTNTWSIKSDYWLGLVTNDEVWSPQLGIAIADDQINPLDNSQIWSSINANIDN